MTGRVDSSMVTSANELPGYRVVRNFGIVRGITVRSRSVLGNLAAGIQTIIGGNISDLTGLWEKAREEAYEKLVQHGARQGANPIVGMRYRPNPEVPGGKEVLA